MRTIKLLRVVLLRPVRKAQRTVRKFVTTYGLKARSALENFVATYGLIARGAAFTFVSALAATAWTAGSDALIRIPLLLAAWIAGLLFIASSVTPSRAAKKILAAVLTLALIAEHKVLNWHFRPTSSEKPPKQTDKPSPPKGPGVAIDGVVQITCETAQVPKSGVGIGVSQPIGNGGAIHGFERVGDTFSGLGWVCKIKNHGAKPLARVAMNFRIQYLVTAKDGSSKGETLVDEDRPVGLNELGAGEASSVVFYVWNRGSLNATVWLPQTFQAQIIGSTAVLTGKTLEPNLKGVPTFPKPKTSVPAAPKISLHFVGTESPALVLKNDSSSVAAQIKWRVLLWNLDDPRIYSEGGPNFPADAHEPLRISLPDFDFVRPKGIGGPMNLFGSPLVSPYVKPGNRLVGEAIVDCLECAGPRFYLVNIEYGRGGWYAEVKSEFLIPRPMTRERIASEFGAALNKVPESSRIKIEPY